jgi:LysR family transcriptional regulator, benzoate and cis,cis-muconate-responsive activator of ben and cat genes
MELRHLRAFVTVAESRSFSKAARHLYVSQPPLSRHIRQLEEELGVTVFERTPSGVTLTREGTLLLERARTVLAEANAFLELASRAKVGATNPLKVGMARGLCEVVNRIRLDLASRHPEIAIEGIDMASSLQYDALREKSIDVGVCRHVADDPAVEYEPLFEEHFVVVVSEQSPLATHKSLTLKQLANQPLLLHDRAWAALSHDKILALYAAAGVVPHAITLHAEPGEQASMLAVASGQGIALALRSPLSRSYVQVNDVGAVPLDEPDAVLQVQVAWRRGGISSPIQEFLRSASVVFGSPEPQAKKRRA